MIDLRKAAGTSRQDNEVSVFEISSVIVNKGESHFETLHQRGTKILF